MGVLNIFVGIALLILGRKLFWLFVACVGFAVGFTYAQQLLVPDSRTSASSIRSEQFGPEL